MEPLTTTRSPDALDAAEREARTDPDNSACWHALGVHLRRTGNSSTALAAFSRALDLQPQSPAVLAARAEALQDVMRFDAAIADLREAGRLSSSDAHIAAALAAALRDSGRSEEALEWFDRAAALAPDCPYIRSDRGLVRIMRGDFSGGFRDHEARWGRHDWTAPKFPAPMWDGSTAKDKTILVWSDLGFGDAILTARFMPEVKSRVGRTLLLCKPELRRVFADLEGVDAFVAPDAVLPHFDLHCPMLSLPDRLGLTPDRIPAPARLAPSTASAKLAPYLAAAGRRLKVGIVWSGNVSFEFNHLRATRLTHFLGLALPGVQLFSLQKGRPVEELDCARARSVVIDLAPVLEDFADTAAAIGALDLVVMTDSSVAHLTGSLGKPIWNLLPASSYWMYLTGRTDSPWYPSMRLFRQKRPGDWAPVFDEVRKALVHLRDSRAA